MSFIGSVHTCVIVPANEEGSVQLVVMFRSEDTPPMDLSHFNPRIKYLFVRGENGIADLSAYPYAESYLLSIGSGYQYWQCEAGEKRAEDALGDAVKSNINKSRLEAAETGEYDRSSNVGKRAQKSDVPRGV